MKKISLLLVSLLAAGSVHAVQFEVSDKLTVSDCADLLTEDVKINLSNNVKAGTACSTSLLSLATCSLGGRNAQRTVEELNCQTQAGEPDRFGNETTVEVCESFDPKQYTETSGAVFYTASSAQGTVVAKYPDGSCSAAAAETQAQARIQ